MDALHERSMNIGWSRTSDAYDCDKLVQWSAGVTTDRLSKAIELDGSLPGKPEMLAVAIDLAVRHFTFTAGDNRREAFRIRSPNLYTDFEPVNDDWGPISGLPSRPCGYEHRNQRPDR